MKSKKRSEFLYFALRNNKLRVGVCIVLFFLIPYIACKMCGKAQKSED